MPEETLGVILKGEPASLRKAERMLKCMLDIQVIHVKRSEGRLWIHEEKHFPGNKRRRRQKPARGKGSKIVIDGELYDRREIEGIMWEWQKEGIIR